MIGTNWLALACTFLTRANSQDTNARTQREMHRLGIDPDAHIGAPQGKQLRGRVVPLVPNSYFKRSQRAPSEYDSTFFLMGFN